MNIGRSTLLLLLSRGDVKIYFIQSSLVLDTKGKKNTENDML